MNYLLEIFSKRIHAILVTLVLFTLSVHTASAAEASAPTDGTVAELETKVIAVDLQTREVSLAVGMGLTFTVFVPEPVNLENIRVGDQVTGAYVAATETDLRAPTEAELADPWVVVQEGEVAADGDKESVTAARQVRAVVTVLAADTSREMIVVTDSRGMMHFIANVEPEKLTDLAAGQKIVVVFAEAVAVKLDKKS